MKVGDNMKPQTAWAVTRYSIDGYSYIDILTVDSLPELSLERAHKADKQCGLQWARDNVIGQAIEISISKT